VVRRGFIFILIAALIAGGAFFVARKAIHKGKTPTGTAVENQQTVLVAMTSHGDASGSAAALTLFGVDNNGKNPVVLFIPVGTLAPIPGAKDFDLVGKALAVGQPALEQITVENLMGIDINQTVAFDDVSLGVFIDQLGGIDIDVQERLYITQKDGTRTLEFQLGKHHMNGAAAITYLTYQSPDTTELDSFVRAQKLWEGVFTAASNDSKFAAAMGSFGTDTLSADEASSLSSIWRAFAARSAADRTYDVLPGQAIGGGGPNIAYQVDDAKLADVVKNDFAGSVPFGVTIGARSKIQLLNGNGSPEVGQKASAMLVPAGLRVEVTGNADNFNYRSTKIVIYGDDAAALALGQEIRNLLGVGTVEVGTRASSVVDVTVVLGKDFLDKVQRS
jgi:anionic cell wall polymer biosynthesis LytR-Cps2A-Psr (LCP) family protein